MSHPTPAQILSTFYAAEATYMSSPPATRDPTPLLATLSPSLIAHQSPDLPWGGSYIGHAGFLAWGEKMTSYFDGLEVLEPKVLEEKDGEGDGDLVVVVLKLRVVVKGSGEVVESPMTQVVRVEREKGWIVEIRPFYWDVGGLRRALGL